MPLSSRLAVRLAQLPHDVLADLAAQLTMQLDPAQQEAVVAALEPTQEASLAAQPQPSESTGDGLPDDLMLELIEPSPAAPPPQQLAEKLPALEYPPLLLSGCRCGERADAPTDAAAVLTARAAGGQMLSTFRIVGDGSTETRAAILHDRKPQPRPEEFHPFTTSGHLYIPASFTLLSFLLDRAGTLLQGRRVCELGAGLGLCSCALGRLGAASRLLATDGCEASLPLLAANLEANCGAGAVEAAALQWGRTPEPLAGSFDLVVAADAVFDVRPPQSSSRLSHTEANAAQLAALFGTAAALLDPSRPDARAVLSVEPRDRLACDWMTRDMLAAAAAAGFALVEERRRQLDGTVRPEWEVDVYVFALQECSRQAA